MLAIQLKNCLASFPDMANVLIYTTRDDSPRQLLMSDLDVNEDGNIIIDGEYDVPVKHIDIEI